MKITVSEALRLKNELSTIVRKLQYASTANIVLGQTFEDGVPITTNNNFKFDDIFPKLEKSLIFSEEINNKIANFNRENEIDSKIRKLQNLKLKKSVYEVLIPKSKPKTSNNWITVGNTRKKVVVEYKPEIKSNDIKNKIKELKTEIREIQVYVEKANNKSLELNFDYNDIDNLSID